jgi:pyridoxal phosphate enzyme (YggS family)
MSFNHSAYQEIQSEIKISNQQTKLLVVSKNRSLDDLLPIINNNQKFFGENRVQEAREKFSVEFIAKFNLEIHLIGPLQTNKVALALGFFHTIQSIDRLKLVSEIEKVIKKSPNKVITKDFFIQVNIGREPQKAGVQLEELKTLYDKCIKTKLSIAGLMCIPPAGQEPEIFFREMHKIRNELNPNLKLSMGMSNDYKQALKFNSDLIRIGSLLFS